MMSAGVVQQYLSRHPLVSGGLYPIIPFILGSHPYLYIPPMSQLRLSHIMGVDIAFLPSEESPESEPVRILVFVGSFGWIPLQPLQPPWSHSMNPTQPSHPAVSDVVLFTGPLHRVPAPLPCRISVRAPALSCSTSLRDSLCTSSRQYLHRRGHLPSSGSGLRPSTFIESLSTSRQWSASSSSSKGIPAKSKLNIHYGLQCRLLTTHTFATHHTHLIFLFTYSFFLCVCCSVLCYTCAEWFWVVPVCQCLCLIVSFFPFFKWVF